MAIFTASTYISPGLNTEETGAQTVKDQLRKEAALDAISKGFTKITDATFRVDEVADSDLKKVTVLLSAERLP